MSQIITVSLAIEVPDNFDPYSGAINTMWLRLSDLSGREITVEADDLVTSTIEAGISGAMTSNELADTAESWADGAGDPW